VEQLLKTMLESVPNWAQGGGAAAMVWAVLKYLEKRSDERTEANKIIVQREQQHETNEVTQFGIVFKALQDLNALQAEQLKESQASRAKCEADLHEARSVYAAEKVAWDFEIRQLQQKLDGYEFVKNGKFDAAALRKLADEVELRPQDRAGDKTI
jgi:hypothetical protein